MSTKRLNGNGYGEGTLTASLLLHQHNATEMTGTSTDLSNGSPQSDSPPNGSPPKGIKAGILDVPLARMTPTVANGSPEGSGSYHSFDSSSSFAVKVRPPSSTHACCHWEYTSSKIKLIAGGLQNFLFHPVTSSVIATAATGGVVASLVLGQVIPAAFSMLALGYGFQNLATRIHESLKEKNAQVDLAHKPRTAYEITQFVSWINKITSFEVAWTVGILGDVIATTATRTAGLMINAFFIGMFASNFFRDWSLGVTDTNLLKNRKFYQVEEKVDTAQWTTMQKVGHFFSQHKEALIFGGLGLAMFLGGIPNLLRNPLEDPNQRLRIFTPFMFLQEYGVQLVGIAIGQKLQSYNIQKIQRELHELETDDYQQLPWTTRLLDKILSLQQAALAFLMLGYDLTKTPGMALLPLIGSGFLIGANYEQQKQIYKLEESEHMQEMELEQAYRGPCYSKSARKMSERTFEILYTAGMIGVGSWLISTVKNTKQFWELGIALVAAPVFYWITKVFEKRINETALKYIPRFLLSGSPFLLEAQVSYWNTTSTSSNVYATSLADGRIAGIIATIFLGINAGTFRRTIATKKFKYGQEEMHQEKQHTKAAFLGTYFLQFLLGSTVRFG